MAECGDTEVTLENEEFQMAEEGDLGQSPEVEGSDSSYTYECDTCKYDGTVSEGVSFCVVCKEYMCTPCKKIHAKMKLSRDHEVWEGEDLSKSVKLRSSDCFDFIMCDVHKGNIVQYVCPEHDSLLCERCCRLLHRQCKDIRTIDTAFVEEATDQEPSAVIEHIKQVVGKLKDLKRERTTMETKLKEEEECRLQDVENILAPMIKKLEEMQQKVNARIRHIVKVESEKMRNEVSSLDESVSVLQYNLKGMEDALLREDFRTIYIAKRRIDLGNVESLRLEIEGRHDIRMEVKPNEALMRVLQETDNICTLTAEGYSVLQQKESDDFTGPPVIVHETATKRVINERFCFGEPGEALYGGSLYTNATHVCTSPADKDTLVLCDQKNSKIKYINLKEKKLLHSLKICPTDGQYYSEPIWFGVFIDSTTYVVSLPYSKELVTVSLTSGKLCKTGSITIGKQCFGLAYNRERLYVSCYTGSSGSQGEILVIKITGETLGRIGRKGDDDYQFKQPDYIVIDDKERLYVSDRGTKAVTCLTLDGVTIFCYTDADLKSPRGLIVDCRQNVYVCDMDSKNIHIINSDGTRYDRRLFGSNDGLTKPVAMAYSCTLNTVIICEYYMDRLLVFRIV